MRVMHIALGGCLRPPPVKYGLTEDTGGHIAYVLGAAMAQAARGDEAIIVTRAFDEPRLGACHSLARENVAPGCTILRLRTARGGYLAKEDLEAELPALTQAFLDLLDAEGPPDILHAHFADAAILARAAAERFGLPWIYSSHSLALEKAGAAPGPALTRRIEREHAAIRTADVIVASSRDEAERQIPAHDPAAEGRVHRVSPGVSTPRGGDPDRARSLIAPFLRGNDRPILLAIARPIPKKNLVALVEAYGRSTELQARADLVILAGLRTGLTGQGEEPDAVFADLVDAIDRHDLWGRVALPRQHEAADVAALYALAAEGGVFVNPAHHEPFGLTVIEAARADVPVVATRNGGPVDILRTLGFGELVDPGDPDDIAAAILRVLDDPQRPARAAAAGRRARAHYDWARWADRVAGICDELAAPTPVTPAPDRLLVCDIDGTLAGDRAAAARFAAWHAARPQSLTFAVATGRSVAEARRVLAAWGLPRPDLFITSVGTEVWRWAGGALVPCPAFARIMDADWDLDAADRALAPLGLRPQPIYDQRAWKRSFYGTPEDAARAGHALRAAGLKARVVHSHGDLIDVLPAGGGKAAAIRFEAARLGLTPEAVIVAGDSGNDRDMLAAFPHAILPANAAAELADLNGPFRSRRRHADGVLDGLARLGLRPALAIAAE